MLCAYANEFAFSIHPGDLHLFLRRPLFLIVESDNSSVFLGLPNVFNQSCVTLTSPVDVPPTLQGVCARFFH
jgi:hypothetical protein